MNTEKRFWIFMGISAGIHLVFLSGLVNFTIPYTAAQFLEVSLIDIGRPDKPPGPAEERPREKPRLLTPPAIEKEEIPTSRELLPAPQTTEYVSSSNRASIQQAESYGGGGMDEVVSAYLMMIKQKIESGKRYPPDALKREEEGEVHLKFKILPDGNVEDVVVIKSSGFPSLDEDSVRLVKSVAPFPPFPGRYSFSIKVPITYKISR